MGETPMPRRTAPFSYTLSGVIWGGYDLEALTHNARTIWEGMEESLVNVLRMNGLNSEQFNYFAKYEKILVLHNSKKLLGNSGKRPGLTLYYFKLVEGPKEGGRVEVYDESDITINMDGAGCVKLGNSIYHIEARFWSGERTQFEPCPQLNYIYEFLRKQVGIVFEDVGAR